MGKPTEAEMMELMRSICHHTKADAGRFSQGGSALEIERHGKLLYVECSVCQGKWVGLPLDTLTAPQTEANSIIADALRDGRDQEAIAMYVETHWSKVAETYERLKDEH